MNTKVMVIGFSWFGGFTDSCVRALEQLGCHVRITNFNKIPESLLATKLNKTIDAKILKILPKSSGITWRLETIVNSIKSSKIFREDAVVTLHKQLLEECMHFSPDFILVIGSISCLLRYEYLDEIKKKSNVPIFCWYTDDPMRSFYNALCATLYDYIFVSDRIHASQLKIFTNTRRVECILSAGDPCVYRPVDLSLEDRRIYGNDVSFVGAAYSDDGGGVIRGMAVEKLKRWKISVYGDDGWQRLEKYFPTIKQCFGGRILPVEETNKLLNASKIVLNLSHPQMFQGTGTRAFEIALAGAFQLAIKNSEVQKAFDLNKEIVCFESIEELPELVDYYLKHEDERKDIARRAREKALKCHTFLHRMKHIIDCFNEITAI